MCALAAQDRTRETATPGDREQNVDVEPTESHVALVRAIGIVVVVFGTLGVVGSLA